MKIEFLYDRHLQELATSRGGMMQAILDGRTEAPVPIALSSEILQLYEMGGVYIYSSSRITIDAFNEELKHNGNELVPTESNYSTRHLEDYTGNRFGRDDCLSYLMVGVGAASLVRMNLDKLGERRTAKFYLAGGMDASGDWFHTFRFHVVRVGEADWQDHREFVGDQQRSEIDRSSYYSVLML